MILNEYGEIVKECLEQIPQHYIKSKIDEYIIMLNHIHLIIIINNESVGNENFHSLQSSSHITNISNIIKGFKIGCTKNIRQNHNDYIFAWQKSFYDVIIKTDNQL